MSIACSTSIYAAYLPSLFTCATILKAKVELWEIMPFAMNECVFFIEMSNVGSSVILFILDIGS